MGDSGFNKSGIPLFGMDATERAVVTMWQRRCEQTIIIPAFTSVRAGLAREVFKTRGTHSFLVPEQAEPSKALARSQLEWLEKQMTGDFICLGRLTVVDIQLFIVMRFMTSFPGLGAIPLPDLIKDLPWVEAWYKRMEAQPCAGATPKMME